MCIRDRLRLLDLEVKEVPELPDPTLSVQDMKDYGYAWAGVLPAGQEAAEKALEKGCDVYRLYSDNTCLLYTSKAHRLTAEEKEIKAAVMDTLKVQIAYNNDGMRASYRASNHSVPAD